jgi:uncharacterized membrane protein YfcA
MDYGPFLIAGAGFAAGAMNALAGGGSFVTLPALIAAGLPSVIANTSSTVALFPSGVTTAWAYWAGAGRGQAPVRPMPIRAMTAITLVGGLIGSVVLLATPSHAFDRILPWLLLAATLALWLGPRYAEAIRGRMKSGEAALLVGQFAIGVYGGYFGGAMGIMMLAFWSLIVGGELRAFQAPRTLLNISANVAAVAWFVGSRAVDWRAVVIMAPAAIAGAGLGVVAARRAPPIAIRIATIALAAFVTAAFFVRAFGPR